MWKLIDIGHFYLDFTRVKNRLTGKSLFRLKSALSSKIEFSIGHLREIFFALNEDDFAGGTSPFFATSMHPIDAIFMN